MNKRSLTVISCVVAVTIVSLAVSDAVGQLPSPAVPIAEVEIKPESLRMRSRALEMFRKESKKATKRDSVLARENFEELKKDFTQVQRLQDEIVKIYTTQRTIDFKMLGNRSRRLVESAQRLHKYLFPDLKERFWEDPKPSFRATTNLRDSIIKVDNALGKFIKSPMFKERAVLDLAESEKARRELEIMIRYANRIDDLSDSNK